MSFALLLTPLFLFAAILLLLLPVLARLLRQCHAKDVPPEWLENFSPASYQLMEGLLADEDFNFLVRQPGFEQAIEKKLRRERIMIFRQYLNRLIADFNRLHVCARLFVTQGREDRSRLLVHLIWLRLRFSVTVLRVEFSLLLSRFGFEPRVVAKAIARLDDLHRYLHALAAA